MALNAVAAAAVAGVASTAVCHPLDTIRTRLQTASLSANANASASGHHGSGGVYYRGPLDCLAQTVRHEGVGALYKGLAAPLAAQAVYKAVIFGSYGQASEALGSNAHAAGSAARLWRVFACGCFAGSVNALVVCPIELVRNRLMVQSSAAGQQRFRGALDCVRQTVRTERGGPLALWRGVSSTVLRDGPGLGLWFVSFELSKQALQASAGLPTDSTANLFLSGGTFRYLLTYLRPAQLRCFVGCGTSLLSLFCFAWKAVLTLAVHDCRA